jgi:uncharacterized protein (TIGR04255 family)
MSASSSNCFFLTLEQQRSIDFVLSPDPARSSLNSERQNDHAKYSPKITQNNFSKLNITLEVADAEISDEETFLRAVVLSHPFKIQLQLVTDAKITSTKLPIDPNTPGTLLSLDCFKDQPALEADFLGNVSENLELAHAKEKELFFRLLKDELLQTLQPEYENAT